MHPSVIRLVPIIPETLKCDHNQPVDGHYHGSNKRQALSDIDCTDDSPRPRWGGHTCRQIGKVVSRGLARERWERGGVEWGSSSPPATVPGAGKSLDSPKKRSPCLLPDKSKPVSPIAPLLVGRPGPAHIFLWGSAHAAEDSAMPSCQGTSKLGLNKLPQLQLAALHPMVYMLWPLKREVAPLGQPSGPPLRSYKE